jgi:hypothetical protein
MYSLENWERENELYVIYFRRIASPLKCLINIYENAISIENKSRRKKIHHLLATTIIKFIVFLLYKMKLILARLDKKCFNLFFRCHLMK